jgi:hypothetical protein
MIKKKKLKFLFFVQEKSKIGGSRKPRRASRRRLSASSTNTETSLTSRSASASTESRIREKTSRTTEELKRRTRLTVSSLSDLTFFYIHECQTFNSILVSMWF